jgi:hypothetical protein
VTGSAPGMRVCTIGPGRRHVGLSLLLGLPALAAALTLVAVPAHFDRVDPRGGVGLRDGQMPGRARPKGIAPRQQPEPGGPTLRSPARETLWIEAEDRVDDAFRRPASYSGVREHLLPGRQWLTH